MLAVNCGVPGQGARCAPRLPRRGVSWTRGSVDAFSDVACALREVQWQVRPKRLPWRSGRSRSCTAFLRTAVRAQLVTRKTLQTLSFREVQIAIRSD